MLGRSSHSAIKHTLVLTFSTWYTMQWIIRICAKLHVLYPNYSNLPGLLHTDSAAEARNSTSSITFIVITGDLWGSLESWYDKAGVNSDDVYNTAKGLRKIVYDSGSFVSRILLGVWSWQLKLLCHHLCWHFNNWCLPMFILETTRKG